MAQHIIALEVAGEQPLTRSAEYAEDLRIAIADFIHENHFLLNEVAADCFTAHISKDEQRIQLTLFSDALAHPEHIGISMKPLRGLMRDYLMMVESYQQAIRDHDTRKIEAVDMGRRGMHNEGAELLQAMLAPKVDMDHCTARRLFTLVAILHMK